jgi:2-oxoglutarate dehydrogenase E2 component (dihydrolipoamide succinyltransferase)
MAKQEGIDLAAVEGTGIHGRVTKQDLEQHLARAEKGAEVETRPRREPRPVEVVPTVRREPSEFSVAPYAEGEEVEIEPMSKIRQLTAAHMVYSKATSAHVTTVFHVDMSRVARARNRARAGFERQVGTKLTYMPFIFKAVASALKAHRKLNASLDGSNIVYKKNINVGMAVALDWGLIVPVIRNADQLNLIGLARAANDLADRARGKKLKPEEVQRGTFTITNPGVFGSLFGTPVINQPQVAILGIGAIEKRPVVATDEYGNDVLAIKTMSYFAITYDHRLVDGADADHFMNDLRRNLAEDSWSELDPFV